MICVIVTVGYVCGFFFFKRKTAYEMRISDWSSEVCSSDLRKPVASPADGRARSLAERRAGVRRRDGAGVDLDPADRRGREHRGCQWLEGGRRRHLGRREMGCAQDARAGGSSAERRVGKEWGGTCRARGAPSHKKKKKR